jgi:hypothetical protein
MILGLLQLGCFLGTAWCIGHLVERFLGGGDDRLGPPPGWTEPTTPPGPVADPVVRTAPADDHLPVPAGTRTMLCVPVGGGQGDPAIRVFRTPLGAPTAVGFSTTAQLHAVLGADHRWVHLADAALRSLVAPLGVTSLVVDPTFAAPVPAEPRPVRMAAPAPAPAPSPALAAAS